MVPWIVNISHLRSRFMQVSQVCDGAIVYVAEMWVLNPGISNFTSTKSPHHFESHSIDNRNLTATHAQRG